MAIIAGSASVRTAGREDVSALAELMSIYVRETYNSGWHGSAEALLRDGFGREFDMQVASIGGNLVGLAAWRKTYDLHHCMSGGEMTDMFVVPELRGKSIGPLLVCAVAAEVRRNGGQFLRGQAVDEPSVRRLYERVAIGSANVECTLSGRAFRTLADLARASPRQVAGSLPPKSWNYEG